MDSSKSNYDELLNLDATGNHQNGDFKTIVYPFDKYEIKVKLSMDNKFIGIVEIKLNKEFLSFKQKMASQGVHDVDKFYRE